MFSSAPNHSLSRNGVVELLAEWIYAEDVKVASQYMVGDYTILAFKLLSLKAG